MDGDRLTRRHFMGAGGAATAMLAAPAVRAAADPLVVGTRSGRVRGARDGGVLAFRGIPYGASTAGARRFRAPEPPQPWSGVRDASRFGPQAPQLATPGAGGTAPVQGEDCLVLNIWTPAADDKRRPVMVWVHGGGFAVGSGADPVTSGARLCAREDVVLVTLNHRLNALGYLYFGDLAAPGSVVANPGQLDIAAALGWVRDNIAAFGGDPGQVMVFGHSGGGSKVACLLAMPAAAGLLHRAGLQSGFGTYGVAPEEGMRITAALFAALGIARGDIDALRAVPVARLLGGLQQVTKGNPMLGPGIVADGAVLPHIPFAPDAPPIRPEVPMLVGHTATETTVLFPPPGAFALDGVGLAPALEGKVREPVPLIEGFRRLRPRASPSDLYFAITTEAGMGRNARIVLEKRATQASAPAYGYVVEWRSPADGGRLASHHGVELPMVFDTVGAAPGIAPRAGDAQALAEEMRTRWAAFARSGSPNAAGLAEWSAYRAPDRTTMVFDRAGTSAIDPLGAEQALIATYA